MDQQPVPLLFQDAAIVCVVLVFAVIFYMRSYLKKNTQGEQLMKVENSVWLETLFYFRDMTKKEENPAHWLYPLALGLLVAILSIFCINIVGQLDTLHTLARYGLIIAIGGVVGIIIYLFRKLSRKDYSL